jgi:hypothetical protein
VNIEGGQRKEGQQEAGHRKKVREEGGQRKNSGQRKAKGMTGKRDKCKEDRKINNRVRED